eukprot:7503913-Pyramimonas_sp.AAC.1
MCGAPWVRNLWRKLWHDLGAHPMAHLAAQPMAQVIVRNHNVWCNASGKPWRNQPAHSRNIIMTTTTVLPPFSLC